jgi:antitoxin component of MazEF toxin-antitoxin module
MIICYNKCGGSTMSNIIRIGKSGRITLPREVLDVVKTDSAYEVQVEGNTLRISPVEEDTRARVERLQAEAKRFWAEGTPEERAARIMEWLNEPRPPVPHLPDEALRRESFYD